MKFVIKWAKLKDRYAIVDSPNKTIAYNKASYYRDDVIVYGYDDKVLSYKDYERMLSEELMAYASSDCTQNLSIDIDLYPNTYKLYGYQSPEWDEPKEVYCHPSELESFLKKTVNKKGFILTAGNVMTFSRKFNGKPKMILMIKEIKNSDKVKLLR